MEEVTVRVRGVQRCVGEEEVTELCTHGTFKRTSDGWLAAYEELRPEGCVRTLLRCDGTRVSLTRRGAVRSEMTFAAGERHSVFYELGVGSLTMELLTKSVRTRQTGAGILLELAYELAACGETASENELTVRIEPRKTGGADQNRRTILPKEQIAARECGHFAMNARKIERKN